MGVALWQAINPKEAPLAITEGGEILLRLRGALRIQVYDKADIESLEKLKAQLGG